MSVPNAQIETTSRSDVASIPCCLCGESLVIRFRSVTDPLTGEIFSIYTCPKCGLGQTWPVPENIAKYYETAYYGSRHGITARMCDRRRVGFVRKVTSKAGRLLDVGCGEGTFLVAIQAEGWTVFGNEINTEPARARGLNVSTEIEGGPYNCITLWHSLEHMNDPLGLIRKLRELLAPDGVIIVAVPDAGGLQARTFGADWFHLDVPRHLVHFNVPSMETLMALAQMRIERRWRQEFEYDLFGWPQSALNKIMTPRNALADVLMGRPRRIGPVKLAANYLLGGIMTVAALPFASGGTIVVAARKNAKAV